MNKMQLYNDVNIGQYDLVTILLTYLPEYKVTQTFWILINLKQLIVSKKFTTLRTKY